MASAAYSFVRFSGGAVAPWLAGRLGERSAHLPFWMGAAAVVAAVVEIDGGRAHLGGVDSGPEHGVEPAGSRSEAEAITVGT